MREDTQMGVIDIAVNHRTSAQNEPDLHKCYKLGYPKSGFHIVQKKKTGVCFIMCIDGIDHAQRTLHDLFIYLFICLAASFDCDYRLLSGQLYKNMNVKHL
jgi:hypothetical protein